jgi:hypothetical protein
VFPLAASCDLLFLVKMHLSAGVDQDELRVSVELAVSGAEQHVVLPILSIKLPRSFEQLEELTDNVLFFRICNYAYHREGLLAQRRYGLLVRPKPFLKNDEAKKDFMVVVLTGAVFLEDLLHCGWSQIIIYLAFPTQQNFFHLLLRCSAKPIIHNIHAKSPLFPSQDRRRKKRLAHLTMQPLS